MKWTPKQIAELPVIWMGVDQFIAKAKKLGKKKLPNRRQILKLPAGTFLGIFQNRNGKWYRIHLQTIFIRRIHMKYRVATYKNKKGRGAYELLIANFPLPKFKT